MIRLLARIEARLPGSLLRRIQALFAAFVVVVTVLAVLAMLSNTSSSAIDHVTVLASAAVIGAYTVAQYRRDGLPVWADPIPIVAVFALGWARGSADAAFGLTFVLLYARALHGSIRRVGLNALAYFVAYEALVVATESGSLFGIETVTMSVGIACSTVIIWLLGDVARTHERATDREVVLARVTSALQRVDTPADALAVAVDGATDLLAGTAEFGIALWRGDERVLRLAEQGSGYPDGAPVEIPLNVLPDDIRALLESGDPFVLDPVLAGRVRAALHTDHHYNWTLVVPLQHGTRLSGALTVSTHEEIPSEVASSLGRLAADAGLALDRAESQVVLRRVVDNSSDAILLLDEDLTVGFANPAVEGMLGYGPAELTGEHIGELLVPRPSDPEEVLALAAFASERRVPEVLSMRHADGSLRRIELAASRLSRTRSHRWVVNLRDVTRRMEIESALRESEQRFRSLAENVSEGLYQMTFDPEPRYQFVNPAMERISGYSASDWLSDPGLALTHVHPDDLELILMSRTAPDDVRWPVEIRWRHPERGWGWIAIRETVLHGPDGSPVCTMGILSDVTARREHEQVLRSALEAERQVTDELRRVDTMKMTFLQAVSHELRTPLTAITGFTKTLRRRSSSMDEATSARLLERLEFNADKLERMLIDLLDLSRLASTTIEAQRRPTDVAALCRSVVKQIDDNSHPVELPSGSLVVELDAPKVERVVENLVRNAIRHTDEGTPITVAVVSDERGDGVVLTVSDRGPGIPRNLWNHIFDPFVQGPQSAAAPKPGTGIGLALVARFAELHGGRAWLEEADGGGARFCVWFAGPSAAAEQGGHGSVRRAEGLTLTDEADTSVGR